MAIANELSSDVAAAVLTHDDNGVGIETKNLVEIVRDFHLALRHLTVESRRSRAHQIHSTEQPQPPKINRAVSGTS